MGHAYLRPCKRFLRHEPPTEGDWAIIEALGRFGFAPLVCEEPRLAASVEIVMLRPEPEGQIFVGSGDTDNRLKTLLDASKMPNEQAALPGSAMPVAFPIAKALEASFSAPLTEGSSRQLELARA